MEAREQFFEAIRSGDAATAERLLDADVGLASAEEGGLPALLYAAYRGKSDIAKAIAARLPRLTLHEACVVGDAPAALKALDSGEDVNAPAEDGHYPVGLAIFFGHPDLARTLLERGADVRLHSKNAQNVAPVHAATTVGDRATLELLLARGADANARQQEGYTPLHSAAARGDFETAKLLLRHGADPRLAGTDGKTPADYARERGQQNFAEWLESQ